MMQDDLSQEQQIDATSNQFVQIPTNGTIATIQWLKSDRANSRIFAYTIHDDDQSCVYFRMHKPGTGVPTYNDVGSISLYDLISQQSNSDSSTFASISYNHFVPSNNNNNDTSLGDLSIHLGAKIIHLDSLTPNLLAVSLSTGAIILLYLKVIVSTQTNLMDFDTDFIQEEFINVNCLQFITFENQSRSTALQSSFSITSMDSIFYPDQIKTNNNNDNKNNNGIINIVVGTDYGVTYGIQYTTPLQLVSRLEFNSSNRKVTSTTDSFHTLLSTITYKVFSFQPMDYLLTQLSLLPTPVIAQNNAISSLQLTPTTLSISLYTSKYILQFSFTTILEILQNSIAANKLNQTTTPSKEFNLTALPKAKILFIPSNFTFPYYNRPHTNTIPAQMLLSKHNMGGNYGAHSFTTPSINPTSPVTISTTNTPTSNLLFAYDHTTSALFIFNTTISNHINDNNNQHNKTIFLPELIIPLLYSSHFQPAALTTSTTNPQSKCTNDNTTGTPTKTKDTLNNNNNNNKIDFDLLYSRPPQQTSLHSFTPLTPASISVYPHLQPLNKNSSTHSLNFGSATPTGNNNNNNQSNTGYEAIVLIQDQSGEVFSIDVSQVLIDKVNKEYLKSADTSEAIASTRTNHHHVQNVVRYVPMKKLYPLTDHNDNNDTLRTTTHPLFTSHPFVPPTIHQQYTKSAFTYDPVTTCGLFASEASISYGNLAQ